VKSIEVLTETPSVFFSHFYSAPLRALREIIFLVDREVAAVFSAAALSVLSAAKRPDSPLFKTPAIETASSFLSASSIFPTPPVARLSPIASAASFGNVGGVEKVPPVNTRPAPAVVSKVEFDCVFGHGQRPPSRNA
jgi:hypothetical protein